MPGRNKTQYGARKGGGREREIVETVREEKRFGITVSRSTETVTTTRELVYEDFDQDGFREQTKKVVKQSNIPKRLKPQAETFLSELHADLTQNLPQLAGDYILPGGVGPGRRVEAGLGPSKHGETLYEAGVKPTRIIDMLNIFYITPDGQKNEIFMDIVKEIVSDRMGIPDEDRPKLSMTPKDAQSKDGIEF